MCNHGYHQCRISICQFNHTMMSKAKAWGRNAISQFPRLTRSRNCLFEITHIPFTCFPRPPLFRSYLLSTPPTDLLTSSVTLHELTHPDHSTFVYVATCLCNQRYGYFLCRRCRQSPTSVQQPSSYLGCVVGPRQYYFYFAISKMVPGFWVLYFDCRCLHLSPTCFFSLLSYNTPQGEYTSCCHAW